ncbi:MAG: SpoIIE family protein phosphatase [Planctomycetaceae bacterium]|nr:SpoIIE family protein phosphatase [Planctomycetaceae bacterium]
MRILVGWDDPLQAETLSLILNVDNDEAVMTNGANELLNRLRHDDRWDVILMALGDPDMDTSFEVFNAVRSLQPNIPVVGASAVGELYRLPRFLKQGMKNYVLRDEGGDFIFMLHAMLFIAVEAVRAEREKELAGKLREEISSVRKLQESIIPSDFSSPDGYSIAARYEPSQIQVLGGQPVVMAGGDYYEVFRLDKDRTVVLVGDASGHGMKACMSIMTMHTLITMIRSQSYDDVATFVAAVNNRLCEQSFIQSGGGFITVLYGVLHSDRHEFTWTSAGHPIPLLCRRTTGEVTPLGPFEAGGLPLGLYSDAEYESHTTKVPEDGRLLIFTDGLPEAFGDVDGRHKEFGTEGMIRTLAKTRQESALDTLQALFDETQAITNGAGRHDDSSVVVVDRS